MNIKIIKQKPGLSAGYLLLSTLLFLSCQTGQMRDEEKIKPTTNQVSSSGDRVADATAHVGELLTQKIRAKGLQRSDLRLYFRAFKEEGQFEVWAKNDGDHSFLLLNTYVVCEKSGSIGPKRKQGDYQVPEGYYHIDRFNPKSRFHLSLGVNYPNISDRILGIDGSLGGDIFIHGDCVTIGCLPMTNEKMEEIYLLALWAKEAQQGTIPVTIFPARLDDSKMETLKNKHKDQPEWLNLWADLKVGFDYFNNNKQLPSIRFLDDGRHQVGT